jgi:zinc/manganese transport system substrate-binding protein
MEVRIDNDSHYIMSLLGALVVLAGISSCTTSSPQDSDRISVVATTGIIGDVIENVGGKAIDLATLIPTGVDPHEYAPSAQQVAAISSADFVFANGLGLEENLIDLLAQSESEGLSVTYLADHVEPIDRDPHFWHDPIRMSRAAELIAEALGQTSSYPAKLEQLDNEVEDLLREIPAERRLLITGHDSFDYFADRYGFEILATIVPGGGSLGSPSSADLAALIELIERHAVPAIFVESTSSPELAEMLASEANRPVEVVELASDSLGAPGSATATYIDLVRFNARAIASALGG